MRERASFHLAVPMLESWFFADPASLARAGVPADRLPARLRPSVDPEFIEVSDLPYASDDGAHCTEMLARNQGRPARQHQRPPWALAPLPAIPDLRRERHPKAYLAWLCRNAQHPRCSTFRESEGGVAALIELNWRRVLAHPEWCAFARAMIADLGDV